SAEPAEVDQSFRRPIEGNPHPVHHVDDARRRFTHEIGRASCRERVYGTVDSRAVESDRKQVKAYDIPTIDLVIVVLYPFEETVAAGGSEADFIVQTEDGIRSLHVTGVQTCALPIFRRTGGSRSILPASD